MYCLNVLGKQVKDDISKEKLSKDVHVKRENNLGRNQTQWGAHPPLQTSDKCDTQHLRNINTVLGQMESSIQF